MGLSVKVWGGPRLEERAIGVISCIPREEEKLEPRLLHKWSCWKGGGALQFNHEIKENMLSNQHINKEILSFLY